MAIKPMLATCCACMPSAGISVLCRALTAYFAETLALPMQATLAACNVAGIVQGYPNWGKPDVLPFVDGAFEDIPQAAPSIVNAKDVGL